MVHPKFSFSIFPEIGHHFFLTSDMMIFPTFFKNWTSRLKYNLRFKKRPILEKVGEKKGKRTR